MQSEMDTAGSMGCVAWRSALGLLSRDLNRYPNPNLLSPVLLLIPHDRHHCVSVYHSVDLQQLQLLQ